jgi:hypothetical protein
VIDEELTSIETKIIIVLVAIAPPTSTTRPSALPNGLEAGKHDRHDDLIDYAMRYSNLATLSPVLVSCIQKDSELFVHSIKIFVLVFVCALLWIWGWLCTYAGGVEDARRHGWGQLFCESDDDDLRRRCGSP